MKLKAYGKINLSLHVLGVRPDSYHELYTVMQTVDLYDTLEFSPASSLELTIELTDPAADLSAGSDNLVCKAAALLAKSTGFKGGARIKLVKRIPLAAGLAGGSADAAATLRGLNSLWQLNLSLAELTKLSEALGSDVPFCLRGGTALARGRGEILKQLPDLPSWGVLLAKPAFGLRAAQVYKLYDALEHPQRQTSPALPCLDDQSELRGLSPYLVNDLEQVVVPLYPEITLLKDLLSAVGAAGVLMSGSGPTVFGLFENRAAARQAAGMLTVNNCQIWAREFCQSQ